MWVHFTLAGDGIANCPVPIGTSVKMGLLRDFHIRDGMIARGIFYDLWLKP